MDIFDQKRYPARFAVFTATLGGLAVVAISAFIGRAFSSALSTYAVPLWSLLAATGGMLVSLYLLWARRRRGVKRVFLIASAFSRKYWINTLVQNMHRSLDRESYDLVLKIPDKDYRATGQTRHLRRILLYINEYTGGFIIANEVDRTRTDLVKFCNQTAIPIVFMDIKPFASDHDYPPNTAFVGYDPGKIGELAADWVAAHFIHAQVEHPNVFVVSGNAQQLRQEKFKERLTSELQEVQIVEDVQIIEDTGEYMRTRARDVVQRNLKQYRAKGKQLHAVFCTNDEMALGAVDALLSVGPDIAGKTVVVGVDGTPEVRELIDGGASPLRATVTQDPEKLADHAVDLLERMLNKDQFPIQTLLLRRM